MFLDLTHISTATRFTISGPTIEIFITYISTGNSTYRTTNESQQQQQQRGERFNPTLPRMSYSQGLSLPFWNRDQSWMKNGNRRNVYKTQRQRPWNVISLPRSLGFLRGVRKEANSRGTRVLYYAEISIDKGSIKSCHVQLRIIDMATRVGYRHEGGPKICIHFA